MENKMWGKDKMWMHTCFVFPDQYTVPHRFDMPFSFSSCCACMKRIARFSGFNDLQMQTDMRKLRYLKKKKQNVMVTEIVEGPHFIHHIDLYSNYSGNYILIYPSWYWVSKQFFGKIKSNLPNWRESCSVFTMNRSIAVWIYLPLSFFCCFFFLLFVFSSSAERPRLGFSSQRSSLHCTIVDATLYTTSGREMRVCPSTRKA